MISSLFVITTVWSNYAINLFSSVFRWALSMCETTRVFPSMSRRKFRHPQVIGQIILLSLVASHDLSFSSAPLVGRLVIFGRGSQSGIIRSSQKTTLEILTQIDPSPHTRTTAESYVKPSNHHSP